MAERAEVSNDQSYQFGEKSQCQFESTIEAVGDVDMAIEFGDQEKMVRATQAQVVITIFEISFE